MLKVIKKDLHNLLLYKESRLEKVTEEIYRERKLRKRYSDMHKTINYITERNMMVYRIIEPKNEFDGFKVIGWMESEFQLFDGRVKNKWDAIIHYSLVKDSIEIMDIQGDQNKGYGTYLLNELINYAKHENIKKIWGYLSPFDADHRDIQEHFYKENGFIIDGDKIRMYL